MHVQITSCAQIGGLLPLWVCINIRTDRFLLCRVSQRSLIDRGSTLIVRSMIIFARSGGRRSNFVCVSVYLSCVRMNSTIFCRAHNTPSPKMSLSPSEQVLNAQQM